MPHNKSFNPFHKALEKEFIELFRSCYAGFPKARIKTHESPDFQLIVNRHKTIGIEVVRYSVDGLGQAASGFSLFDPELLLALINKKEMKSAGYQRMRYHALWLLIVSGSNPFEPALLHPDSIDWTMFRSEIFDKLFYLDARRKQLHELQ